MCHLYDEANIFLILNRCETLTLTHLKRNNVHAHGYLLLSIVMITLYTIKNL